MSLLERRPALLYLVITAAWLVLHLFSWNTADWSFGDDFAYGIPVQRMLQTGEMHYTDWSSMTLVMQVWLGALVTKLLGFSYDHLRLISIAFHLSAVLAFAATARRLKISAVWTLLASIIFLCQPLVVELSLCFDTDVPFLGILLWSLYFFVRYLQDSRSRDVVAGLLFCLSAFFIRDLALVVVAAFALALLLRDGLKARSITLATSSVGLLVFAYAGWRWWLQHMHGIPASIDYSRGRLLETWTHPGILLSTYTRNIVYAACYLGLWLLPLSIGLLTRMFALQQKQRLVAALAFGVLSTVALLLTPRAVEEASGQLLNQFVPYAELPNVYAYAQPALPTPSQWMITLVLCIGCWSMGVIVAQALDLRNQLKSLLQRRRSAPSWSFVMLMTLMYTVLIFSQWILHRYYVPLIPMLSLCSAGLLSREAWRVSSGWRAAIGIATVLVVYAGVANGHDFMAHQHASVDVYRYAEGTLGTDAAHMDGGFSYNSLRSYHYSYKRQADKNWWWVQRDDYVIGEAPMLGLDEVYRADYPRWLPPGVMGHVILHKNPRSASRP